MTTYQSFVVSALCVILAAVLAMVGYFVRKISTHDTALAVIVNQINPPGEPSLRETLKEIQIQQALSKAGLLRLENAATIVPHHPSP